MTSESLYTYIHVDTATRLKVQARFEFYIPTSKRKSFAEFREKVDNEGKRVCDVLMDLVESYIGKKGN